MDQQLKEILRQMIKYRFWIAIGLAILFPMIAYLASAGEIKDKTDAAAKKVEGAKNGLKSFGPGFKTRAYSQVVEEKTGDLGKVVDSTWRQLYDRQAPLLDWPEGFEDTFAKWGRHYPEGVDTSVIQNAIDLYKDAYPKYVTKVYNTIKPFDFDEGTGVIVAPSEDELLGPIHFTVGETPTLKQIWDAQERLWLQRTVLDVVAKVNGDAKDWDGAIIKKLAGVDVASESAMDQVWNSKKPAARTAAEKLQTSPPIVPGNVPPPPADPSKGAAAPTTSAGEVQFMAPPGNQYRLYPVYLSVLMDQDHLQDLFTALQNSPMAIEIREVEFSRPDQRVKKPQKGESAGGAELGSYGGSGNVYRSSRVGGSASAQMQMMRGQQAQLKGFNQQSSSGFNFGGQSEGATGPNADRGKVSLREKNKADKPDESEKDAKKDTKKAEPAFDPYYNLVEVRINGIARFYNRPADAPASPTASPGGTEAPANPAAPANATATAPQPPTANAPAPAEPAKAEPGKDAAKADDKDQGKAEAKDKEKDSDKADAKPAAADAKGEAKADEAKPAPDQTKPAAKPAGDAKAEAKGAQ
ncbi:MAG TPA: hypothetical protein VG406_10910 [Isosphaeraceae bacterium]|jgi:hypothetical protein|nr:hypothetical protein [Isosphaeraceae bacterium]